MSSIERETPREIIDRTLNAIHVAGDLILEGRRISLEALNEPPYVPDESVFREMACNSPQVLELTEEQRDKIATMAGLLSAYMEERAMIQQELKEDSQKAKREILRTIRDQWPDSRIHQVNPKKVKLGFGLFSVQIEAEKEPFMILKEIASGPGEGVGGVYPLSRPWLAFNIGRVPLVLGGREAKASRMHEDVHAFQYMIGQLPAPFGIIEDEITRQEPAELIRIVREGKFSAKDLGFCLGLLNKVCRLTKYDLGIELRAGLWERELVGSYVVDRYKELIIVTTEAAFDSLFESESPLSDKEKMKEAYRAILQIFKVEHYRQMINAIVKKTVREYEGEDNPWEWVASRMMVLPPGASLGLTRAVLLGRGKRLERVPKLDTVTPLAQAIMVFARRTISPESPGKGDMVPRDKDKVEEFWRLLEEIFNGRELIEDICREQGIGEEDFPELKKEIIKYARQSVSRGVRGKTRKRLEGTLLA